MDLSPRVDSPDGKHNASISSCDLNSSKRSALLTVSDAAGKQTLQLPIEARPQMGESCIAGGELRWLNDERIAVTCKYDSMLNGYVVVNVKNASVEAQYTGLWFQPSPDGRTVAAVGVSQRYAAPEGSRCCLLFNNKPVYPVGCSFEGEESTSHGSKKSKNFLGDEYSGIHSFLSVPVWSPDGHTVAFVEKTFSFHYDDPYNRDFYGRVTGLQFYLALVSQDGSAVGYRLSGSSRQPKVKWLSDTQVEVDGQKFDRQAQPPSQIP